MMPNLQIMVRGEFLGSTCVPDRGVGHPRGTAELCLREPKSAERKSCCHPLSLRHYDGLRDLCLKEKRRNKKTYKV